MTILALYLRLHEIWALRLGTWLGKGKRSGATRPPPLLNLSFRHPARNCEADPRVAAIAQWARALVQWRDAWLNPPRRPVCWLCRLRHTCQNRTTNLHTTAFVYYRETVRRNM
ncbi:MAG: hypothetical protein H6655_08615 [Ardenticatenaceae bacterium]|nr:hypothetical protein [Ardenticatenaceae bacterium]